jgi:hypothetical protein
MRRFVVLTIGLASFSIGVLTAQTTIVTGDHSTPLRPVNVGVSDSA